MVVLAARNRNSNLNGIGFKAETRAGQLSARTRAPHCSPRARRTLARLPDAGTMPERLDQLVERTKQIGPQIDTLTPAERRVLPLLATHHKLTEIGAEPFITRSTVKSHVRSIYSKLGVTSRAEAVAIFQAAAERPTPTGGP